MHKVIGGDALRHLEEKGKPSAADQKQHRRAPPTPQGPSGKSPPSDGDAEAAVLSGQQKATQSAPSIWGVEATPTVTPH